MPLGETNPDFRLNPTVHALRSLLPEDARGEGWVARLVDVLTDRDRQLEEFFNRSVLRRVKTTRASGNNTLHTGTAWQTVFPQIVVDFYKANPGSHFTVWIAAAGEYADLPFPSWVEFGAQVASVPAGVAAFDNPVARRQANTVDEHYLWAGSADIAPSAAVPLPEGLYALTLRVRGQQAGTQFTSRSSGSLCLTVTESP